MLTFEKKMELARMRLEHRWSVVRGLMKDIQWFHESLNNALDRGYYNEAAQYAEKIAQASYKVDVTTRELQEFQTILKDFDEE